MNVIQPKPFRLKRLAIFSLVTLILLFEPAFAQEQNVNRPGKDYTSFVLQEAKPELCQKACNEDPRCKAYTYVKPGLQGAQARCWLKSEAPTSVTDECCISGVKNTQSASVTGIRIPDGLPANDRNPVGILHVPIPDPKSVGQDPSRRRQAIMTREENANRPGSDYKNFALRNGETQKTCADACLNDPNCQAYTFVKAGVQGQNAHCWLKNSVPAPIDDVRTTSGIKKIQEEIKFDETVTLLPEMVNHLLWSAETGPAVRAGVNLPGNDYKSLVIPSSQDQLPQTCQKICLGDPKCEAWTWVAPSVQASNSMCWLKTIASSPVAQEGCISGIRLKRKKINQQPTLPTTRLTAQEVRDQARDFDARWKTVVKQTLGDLNMRYRDQLKQETLKQEQLYARLAMQQRKPMTLPDPLPNPSYQVTVQNGLASAKLNGKPISPSNAYSGLQLPEMQTVRAVITDPVIQKSARPFDVYEGRYIIIYGQNLGTWAGNGEVRIEYQPYQDEDSILSGSKKPSVCHLILEPYNGSWDKSWFDDFIVARVPQLPVKPESRAQLIIWKDGARSFVIKHDINLHLLGPVLQYLNWVPADQGHLASGARVWIHGAGFGLEQGKIKVTTEADGGLSYDLIVPPGKWSENVIEAIAPEFPQEAVIEGDIHVFDAEGNDQAKTIIRFGPRMADIWISGNEFLELHKPQGDTAEIGTGSLTAKNQNFLAVTHYPGCGFWRTGEDGDDYFFNKMALPSNIKITGYYFLGVKYDSWENDLNFGLGEFENLLLNPVQFAIDTTWMAIGSTFNSEFGWYQVNMVTSPSPDHPLTKVNYHTTCWGPHDGLPIKYLVSFRLRGPEKEVNKLGQ